MRHVDLCSGIGGFALGFEWAGLSTPVLFCDIEKWCRDILKQHWNNVPIKSDVKELANDPDNLVPDCDILTAGYPCQPFSQAGKRQGEEDPRHIWPSISKIIASKRPSWVVLENVYGHISLGLDQVLLDLETKGYATRTFVVPASSVGAPHRRDRVWIVANTASIGVEGLRTSGKQESHTYVRQEVSVRTSKDVADTVSQRTQSGSAGRQDAENVGQSSRSTEQWDWNIEPDVGRVANGIPKRVDRLKGLGNAIVPQIAQQIAEAIKVAENG